MKCHYFKENTELYRVQLYSSLWMGAIESIYLTFYSNLKIFLVFLPLYLHYSPRVISHGLQQTEPSFPKPLFCGSFLSTPS